MEASAQKRRQQAEAKIRRREISRARVLLTSTGLAPGDASTLRELRDPALRPPRLTERIDPDVFTHQPQERIIVDPAQLLAALRSAGRGSAPDLAVMRYEHLRVLLEEEEHWGRFTMLAQAFARAEVPDDMTLWQHFGWDG